MAKLAYVEILIVQMPEVAIGQDDEGNKYVAGYDGNKIYVTVNHEIFRTYNASAEDWQQIKDKISVASNE